MDRTGKVKLAITAIASSASALPMPSHAKRYGSRRLKAERAITNAHKGPVPAVSVQATEAHHS
jgi:hypothetical protein